MCNIDRKTPVLEAYKPATLLQRDYWEENIAKFLKTSIFKDICKRATVCSCHVTYALQSESTLCSCLNFKKLLAQSRREIWSLSNCNWTRTHNPLVHKWALNHLAKLVSLAKWLSVCLWTKWLFESSCCERLLLNFIDSK